MLVILWFYSYRSFAMSKVPPIKGPPAKSRSANGERRAVPEVEPPARDLLKLTQVFGWNGKPQPHVLKKHFLREGRVDMNVANKLIEDATAILKKESTVLDIKGTWKDVYFFINPLA